MNIKFKYSKVINSMFNTCYATCPTHPPIPPTHLPRDKLALMGVEIQHGAQHRHQRPQRRIIGVQLDTQMTTQKLTASLKYWNLRNIPYSTTQIQKHKTIQ